MIHPTRNCNIVESERLGLQNLITLFVPNRFATCFLQIIIIKINSLCPTTILFLDSSIFMLINELISQIN